MPTPRTHFDLNLIRPACAALLLAALTLGGCGTSPKLSERDAVQEATSQISELVRNREKARGMTREAEAIQDENPIEAIRIYRESLRLDDAQQLAWNNLGTLLMEQGNYADAVNAFSRASQLVPGDPRPEYNIGIAYQRNGWGEDAYRHFGNAMDRDPSHMPSMRGFIRAAEMTGRADNTLLATIKSATLRETDPRWREYLARQRYRVEAVLNER